MNNFKELLVVVLSLIALLATSFAHAEDKARVSFAKEVEVHAKTKVTLYDLVELQIGKAEILNDFKNLVVVEDFNTEELTIAGPQILKKFKESFKGLFLEMPSHIKIKKSATVVSNQQVKREVLNHLRSLCADCDFAVSSLVVPAIHNPQIEIDFAKLPIKGSFMIPISEVTNKGLTQRWITGQIKTYKDVLITTKMIQMGQRITTADLRIKKSDITFVKETDVNMEEFVGQLTSRPISPNTVLARTDIKREPAVKRGSPIKVTAGTEQFEISISGVAEENGFAGDTIRFKNSETQKVMTGVVTEPGTVRIQ